MREPVAAKALSMWTAALTPALAGFSHDARQADASRIGTLIERPLVRRQDVVISIFLSRPSFLSVKHTVRAPKGRSQLEWVELMSPSPRESADPGS